MTREILCIPDATCVVCLGSGRFLLWQRAVLVPLLTRVAATNVVIFQPRGTAFASACTANDLWYEVDTTQHDGSVTTERVQLAGVGTLAQEADRHVFFQLPLKLPQLRYIGVGITDAGFVRGSTAICDLVQFLFACHTYRPDNVLSIINTDNVPCNGELLSTRVREAQWPDCPSHDSAAWTAFLTYLDAKVHFHNTMVDRLTSNRPTDPLVPRAEPAPSKVLAIQDSAGVLDPAFATAMSGVVIRGTRDELLLDQKLKLRIANATSSALVYVLSLSRYKTNNEARLLPHVLHYRDALFQLDILPSLQHEGVTDTVALDVYTEWTHRSAHPYFGLVNLWVTQNAWLHFTTRLFPSIRINVSTDNGYRVSRFLVFTTASILRFLTPFGVAMRDETRVVYVGAMDDRTVTTPVYPDLDGDWIYGSGLRANLTTGEYEFLDAPQTDVAVQLQDVVRNLKDTNADESLMVVKPIVVSILSGVEGFDGKNQANAQFADDVATIYVRLVRGKLMGTASALEILQDVVSKA